jgi:hypothetical protein
MPERAVGPGQLHVGMAIFDPSAQDTRLLARSRSEFRVYAGRNSPAIHVYMVLSRCAVLTRLKADSCLRRNDAPACEGRKVTPAQAGAEQPHRRTCNCPGYPAGRAPAPAACHGRKNRGLRPIILVAEKESAADNTWLMTLVSSRCGGGPAAGTKRRIHGTDIEWSDKTSEC